MTGLADILMGRNALAGDPGPDDVYGTEDVRRMMNARRAAQEREPYEALTRLFTTALAPMGAAATRAAAPNTGAEPIANMLGRWGQATALHQRGEMKRGNPEGFPLGLLAAGSTAAAFPAAAPYLAGPWGFLMAPHFSDIRNIAHHLARVQQREQSKRPLPDNSGTTLY